MWRHRCTGGLKKKLYLRSGSQCHRHFVGFFNMPVLHRHGTILFSSPEPKAQVSYCHSAPSVVRPSVNFHIFNFFSRTAWWILMKLGRDKVLMVPYKCCCFSARLLSIWFVAVAFRSEEVSWRRGPPWPIWSPASRNFFFRPEGYSDKPNG